jgi:DNA-binding MarR family transcriptional regulator
MVNTTNGQHEEWLKSRPRLKIAEALLSTRRPMTTGEIGRKGGVDQSNVIRMASRMTDEGILVRHAPPKDKRRAGRKPGVAYTLVKEARAALESHLEQSEASGVSTQQHVRVSADDPRQLLSAMNIVAQRGAEIGIDWVARSEGNPQQFVFVFEGNDALERAEDLMAAFAILELDCSRRMFTGICSGEQAVRDARRMVKKARLAQELEQAAWQISS